MLNMDFSTALINIKGGHKLARESWAPVHHLEMVHDDGGEYIAEMYAVLNVHRQYVWVPAQSDILAEDWKIVGVHGEEDKE